MDVDAMPAGVDFLDYLRVTGSGLVLILIGPRWLATTDAQGFRRLDQSEDVVALEIELALRHNIKVIPALIDGAQMPKAAELPHRLAQFARRQAVELDNRQFGRDVLILVDKLRHALKGRDPTLQ
jgi:hypothetical protein